MLTKGTKRTYAQGTKLMAVAGGIKPVPLKMTGLRSSVSIQFGDDLSKYFGEKTLHAGEMGSSVKLRSYNIQGRSSLDIFEEAIGVPFGQRISDNRSDGADKEEIEKRTRSPIEDHG